MDEQALSCRARMVRNGIHAGAWALGVSLSLALVGGCGGEASDGERPPDVVLLVIDTLRADRLSCYGYDRNTTPFLDSLAAEGTLFEDVTAQFAWTLPSMVSIFSSRYLGGRQVGLSESEESLAEVFEQAGYVTVGAVANALIQTDTGLAQGFDHFFAPDPSSEEEWSLEILAQMTAPILSELDAKGGDQRRPVFLYLHALEPHDPYVTYADWESELPLDGAEPLPADGWHSRHLEGIGFDSQAQSDALELLSERRARYDHELRQVDRQAESAFGMLESWGLLSNAIVSVVSDHGEGLWDHVSPIDLLKPILNREASANKAMGYFYKKHGAIQFQEVTRTPWILWGRGVPAGVRVSRPVENVDVAPTLLELAGLPSLSQAHGRELGAWLQDGEEDAGQTLEHVFSYGVATASVRELASGLKLIIRKNPRTRKRERQVYLSVQLYDLKRDPLEREDLAAQMPAEVERLTKILEAWEQRHPVRAESSETDADQERFKALGYTGDDVGH